MLLSSPMLLTFLLLDFGCPAAVDIYDVLIVSASDVVSGFISAPDVVGLPACCCFTSFASILALAGVLMVLAVLMLL
jgi:hypothetical protein